MNENPFDLPDVEIHWCPGCGNFSILDSLKESLFELQISQQQLVIISGIGQAAKTPHFMKVNFVNGLHGRALPVAMAIKAVNPELEVMTISGDGCMFSEGGNHLIHAIRRNINVTTLIYDNFVYGLTKGQASPTSLEGFETAVQVEGVINKPFNPVAFAISQDASFVARTMAGDKVHMKKVFKEAIQHKGFSLVDILQPCVSFNKLNTYKWFKEHSYYLTDNHDPTNKLSAFEKAIDEKFALGVLYKNTKRKPFEDELIVYKHGNKTPLIKRKRNIDDIKQKFLAIK